MFVCMHCMSLSTILLRQLCKCGCAYISHEPMTSLGAWINVLYKLHNNGSSMEHFFISIIMTNSVVGLAFWEIFLFFSPALS